MIPHNVRLKLLHQVRQQKADGGSAVVPPMPAEKAVRAPVSPLGFYSPTEQAALNLKRKTGPGQAFLNEITKGEHVNKSEVEGMGLHNFLKSKPVHSREEVQQFVSKSKPRVEAKVLGGDLLKHPKQDDLREMGLQYDPILDDVTPLHHTIGQKRSGFGSEPHWSENLNQFDTDYAHKLADEIRKSAPSYDQYQLPGGQNYREVLLTLPIQKADRRWTTPNGAEFTEEELNDPVVRRVAERVGLRESSSKGAYQSKHWDEPNVLAHIRLNDRVDNEGKKVLFVEELQSDWGQQGKKEGFAVREVTPRPTSFEVRKVDGGFRTFWDNGEQSGLYDSPEWGEAEARRALAAGNLRNKTEGVPVAPFVTKTNDWVDLGLKHIMKHAAENGYDRVAFINGPQSADRYDLSKYLSSVTATPNKDGSFSLMTVDHNGRRETSVSVPPGKLDDYVGKEMADRITKSGGGTFEGENLRVPHKGMEDFYDKLVPAQAQALLKKFGGGKLRHVHIQLEPERREKQIAAPGLGHFPEDVVTPPVVSKQLGFDITPEMRERLKQPIPYKKGGSAGLMHKADGGAVQGANMDMTLAQMRAAIARRGNPIEMQSIGVNEAPGLSPKAYMPPDRAESFQPAPGGVATRTGMPIGGIDTSKQVPGQQLMPIPPGMAPGQPNQPGQTPTGQPQGGMPGAQPNPLPSGFGSAPNSSPFPPAPAQPQPPSNILSMTPQGRALNAMTPATMPNLAKGGRAKFAIQPAPEKAKEPSEFSPYDSENPTVQSLSKAFDEAIKHHLSLSPDERAKNSVRASEKVGDIIGRTSSGKVKDLLGKNAKLLKSEKGKDDEAIKLPDGRGVETTGLALSPAYRQGKFDTCPNHHSCKEECLGKTSGNYFKLGGGQDLNEFKGPRLNSLKKTHAFLHDPHSFAVKLHDEISDAKAIAAQNGNHLGVRLNVLSDINPRIHKSIMSAHPDVTFYDYTKNNTDPIASNHHYTYSSTGVSQPGVENEHTNWKSMRRRLDNGDNVAMAFSHKDHLPEHVHDQETGKKYRVVNGDTHDFRPMDLQPEGETGVIIGLKNKKATGKMNEAHIDSHGFFVHYDPQLKMSQNKKSGAPIYARDKNGNTIAQNKVVNIQPQAHKMIPISNDEGEKV